MRMESITAKALTTGTRINQGHSDLVLVPVFYAELAEASLRMRRRVADVKTVDCLGQAEELQQVTTGIYTVHVRLCRSK